MWRSQRRCWRTLQRASVARCQVATALEVSISTPQFVRTASKLHTTPVSCWFVLLQLLLPPQSSRSYSPRAQAPKEQHKVVLREGLTVKKLAAQLDVGTCKLQQYVNCCNSFQIILNQSPYPPIHYQQLFRKS